MQKPDDYDDGCSLAFLFPTGRACSYLYEILISCCIFYLQRQAVAGVARLDHINITICK